MSSRCRPSKPAGSQGYATVMSVWRSICSTGNHRKPGLLDQLAKDVGLSRSVFVERFSHFVGQPPMQYLAEWRMQIAAGLLTQSSDNVARVAAAVGYESEAAFSRAFKKGRGHAARNMAARADHAIRPAAINAIALDNRLVLPHASPDRRIGFVEARDHFARAALTCDPTEIVVLVQRPQILVGDEHAEPVRRHAAADKAVLARGQLIASIHRAVGVLHRVAALVAEAPMRAVALDVQAR